MDVKIEPSWKRALQSEFDQPYFIDLTRFVKDEYASGTVYPPPKFIFAAFNRCPFDLVKVVIIGQDPYHGPGQANGLCFSVNDSVPLPPSLQNIFKELKDDLGVNTPNRLPADRQGNLDRWADQGVLLLNATLTVRAHQAGSHQNKGWERFTDAVIKILSDQKSNLVFLLWGSYAQKKGAVIDTGKHLVLRSAHPSPLSAHNGFFGSKPFSQTNIYLALNGQEPINW